MYSKLFSECLISRETLDCLVVDNKGLVLQNSKAIDW